MLKPEPREILIGNSSYSFRWSIERREEKIIFSATSVDDETEHIDDFNATFSEKDWRQALKKFIEEQKPVAITGKTKYFSPFSSKAEERKAQIKFSRRGEVIELFYSGPRECVRIELCQKDFKKLILEKKERRKERK